VLSVRARGPHEDPVGKIYEKVDRGIACDIVVYNEKELAEMLPLSRFLRHVLKEGKVVYEARS
jgi:imidazolonepropionase-like amidohydrolase